MSSKQERFWISLILRLGFGFLFLFVAIGQFNAGSPIDHGPSWFAAQLSKPFAASWIGEAVPDIEYSVAVIGDDGKPALDERGEPLTTQVIRDPSYYFLLALPYAFALLSIPILTGIFLRPALRAGAILLVLLGLGKYITGDADIGPTTNNYVLAFLICVGLHFLAHDADPARVGQHRS